MKKNVIRMGVIFFLTAIFLFFFFRSVEWKEVLRYLTDVDLKFFILIILLVPLNLVTRAIRWRYLLKHQKADVKFFNMFAGNAIGFTVTLIFPGRLGELVKPFYLAQKEKMRKGFVLGTVVVERIFDILTNCLLLGLFLIAWRLYPSIFQVNEAAYSNLLLWGTAGGTLAGVLIFVILSLYFFRERTLSVIAFLLKPFPQKLSRRVNDFFSEFIRGLKFFHSFRDFFIYVALSFVVWLGIVFYYWIFFFAYNISISYFLLIPYTFLVMVGASIPTPGMVGGYHYFSKYGLTTLFNIEPNLAVGMTIVVHAVQVVMTCLVGYIILWKEGISLFQIKELREDTET